MLAGSSLSFSHSTLSPFFLFQASPSRSQQSKSTLSQRPPRRARPQARRPEARMVVLEKPQIMDEAESKEDHRQQREVHIHVRV